MKYGSLVLGLRSVGGTFALAVAGVLFAGNAWAAHVHCVCGDGKCDVGGHSHSANANWAPWTATDSLPNTAGNWYLTADVNLTVDYNAPYDVNLCLNGHTVTQTTADKRVITISATDLNKTFRLTDCRGTGKVTGGKLTSGGHGAGVFLNTTATATAIFELYGGSICGNRAEKTDATSVACGGGVYVGKKCQFAMYGGSITNNVVSGNRSDSGTGGGVYAFGESTVAIHGGDICGNTASRYAGGIQLLGALTVGPKARIYGNVAGGIAGICCENNSSITFQGGEIFNNKAEGGLVSDGVGGVGIYTSGCTFSGKVVIAGNLNGDVADDLYLDGKTIALNGLSAGSRIGVHLKNPPTSEGVPVAFTANGAADDRAYFFSNHDGCPVTYQTDRLVIEKATMVRVTPTAVANTTVSVLDDNVPVAPSADGICRVASGADNVKVVYTAASGYEFAGSQTKSEIILSTEQTENDPVQPDVPTAPTLVKSLVVPAAVANATAKIYQGETELTADPCLVALSAADVKVVYTAADGYVFADGTTAKTNAVDASDNPAIAAAPEAPAFVIGSQANLEKALDYVNYTAAADEDIRWYISADFTMTAAAKIEKKVASLTILGNGNTLTAEQGGALITAAFDFVSSDLADTPVVIKDLNLTVKDGFRHGFNLWRSGIDAHCVQLTLDNVNVTLAHTTQPKKGTTPKNCAAIIASYSALTLSGACTITADEYSWAAIDLTATNGLPAAITIASDDIKFVDNRAKETKYVEPLVKTSEESAGAMTATDMARARLYPITLANGTGYLVATMLGGQDALAAAADALTSVPAIWCITNDFTVTQGIEIANLYNINLTILGNGHTLNATKDGTLVGQVFNIKAINNRATLVRFEDFNLVVSDGFRHGVNILREEGYPGIVPAKVTFDNVDITMAHTKDIMKGSEVKTAAAIINNYNDVILTNGCTITADAYCWAAIDVTSKSGFDASLTIASEDITFVDNRTPEMVSIKPLVKVNGDGVTVTGIDRTPLKAVTLEDGPGYSYVVDFTAQTLANATAAVYAGEKEMTTPYQLPSNGTATVVYTAKSGFIFADGITAKTNTVDTSKSPAKVQSDLPAVPAYLITDQATLTKAVNAVTDSSTKTWYIGADFTVTQQNSITMKFKRITILGNNHIITADSPTYVESAFKFSSSPTATEYLSIYDLDLVVTNNVRNGIILEAKKTKSVSTTLDNVNVRLAHAAAPQKEGEDVDCVAIVGMHSKLTFTNACTITADAWSRSAIDLTSTNKDASASMTIRGGDITFVDKRAQNMIAVEPLVKKTNKDTGSTSSKNIAKAHLTEVSLKNGDGWSLTVPLTPTDKRLKGSVYVADTKISGTTSFQIPSNASPVKIVYTPAAGYKFLDGTVAVTNTVDATVNPAKVLGDLPPATAYVITSQTTLKKAITAFRNLPEGCEETWYIDDDFTVTNKISVGKAFNRLTILGNNHKITAAGEAYYDYALVFGARYSACNHKLDMRDLGLVVSNNCRGGIYLQGSTNNVPVDATFDNVDITMSYAAAPKEEGEELLGAPIVNNYSKLSLTNGCTFTADKWSWAALDVTSTTNRDASLTILSDDITFIDNRTPETIAVEPLVTQCDGDGGTVTITGMDKTSLKWLDLAKNHGYGYVVSFTPTVVANTTNCVYVAGKEILGPAPYIVPSNGVPVEVVYTALDGYAFLDDTIVKTNTVDTAKGAATADAPSAAVAAHVHDGILFKTPIATQEELWNFRVANGTGYLTADITLTSDIHFYGPITNRLCLNGHVLKQGQSKIHIKNQRRLAIHDCDKTTPHYFDNNTTYGNWTPTNEVTANVVYGGYILGVDGNSDYGYIGVDEGSCLELCGGTLVGARSKRMIDVFGGSQVLLSGVDLVGNRVEYGVMLSSSSNCTNALHVTGGTFRNNTSWYLLYSYSDNMVDITGGVFRDNYALDSWGTIIYGYESKVTIGGDTVISNNATCGSPALYIGTSRGNPTTLEIRDDVQIVGNQGSTYGGGVMTYYGVSTVLSGRVRIADNEGGNFVVWADVGGSAGAAETMNDTVDLSGLETGAYIGFSACGRHYEIGDGTVDLPCYADEPIVVSSNITEQALAFLHADNASQYLEASVSGEMTNLLLRGRLISEPSAGNNFTYELDVKHYAGGTDEGTAAYQWYPSVMSGRVVKSVDPEVPSTCQYCTCWPTTFDSALDCWTASTNGLALEDGDYAFVGFSAKQGNVVRYVGRPASSSYLPWIGNAEDYYDYCYFEVVEERADGLVEYEVQVPSDGDFYICEWFGQTPAYDTYIISNLTVTSQTIDYDHPLAGQNTKSLDVSGYTDDFSAACVASFKTGDTTDFTLTSRLVHGHVHESMLFDREIASEADLVELLENGGNGCLTADVTLTDEVEIGEGVSVNLCLNGHSIVQTKNDSSTLVLEKGILSLYDCQDHPGCITHTEGCNGPGVYVEGSTFNMYGGVISGNCVPASWKLGGGICNAAGGIVHMYGGMITNNVAPFGGGWAGIVGSTNYFHGGAVCGNEATQAGGGGILNEGVFYMYGGDVYGNIATNGAGLAGMGGGICNLRYFLATGGVIRANVASAGGGLANCHGEGDTEAVLSDVTISDNRSKLGGGAVFAIGALMAFTNCTITSNRGENLGMGGVYGAEVDMTIVDSTITGNAGGTSLQAGVVLAGQLHLGGRVVVSGNVSDGAGPGGNIVIDAEQGMLDVLAAKPLTADSSIGVMILESGSGIVVTGGVFLAACDMNYASRFFSDSTKYRVVANPDNSLELVERTIVVVTYDAQGGEWAGGSNSIEVVCEDETPMYAFPAYPARDGYDFLGWFDGVMNSAAQATNGAAMLKAASHTLYAKWQSKTVDPAEAEETFVFEDEDPSAADTVITGAVKSVTNGGGDFVIPDRVSNGTAGKFVVEIGRLAFAASRYKQDAIESVTTPLYLTNVNAGAFYQVKTLKKLTLTASVDYANPSKAAKLVIGPRAFAGTALDTIVIPTNVTAIGDYAFMNCSKLKTIVFAGDAAFTMGAKAFDSCGYEADGSIRVFLSTALTNAMPTLVESIRSSNPSLKIVPMVGVSPLSGLDISSLTPTDGKIYLRVNVDTVIPGAKPLASTVQVQFTADLGDPNWQPVKSVNTALDGGMVLVEFESPTNPGYLRVCVSE